MNKNNEPIGEPKLVKRKFKGKVSSWIEIEKSLQHIMIKNE